MAKQGPKVNYFKLKKGSSVDYMTFDLQTPLKFDLVKRRFEDGFVENDYGDTKKYTLRIPLTDEERSEIEAGRRHVMEMAFQEIDSSAQKAKKIAIEDHIYANVITYKSPFHSRVTGPTRSKVPLKSLTDASFDGTCRVMIKSVTWNKIKNTFWVEYRIEYMLARSIGESKRTLDFATWLHAAVEETVVEDEEEVPEESDEDEEL